MIRSWKVGEPVVLPDNYADTFAPTLADDGAVYTPSNDTTGFGNLDFFDRTRALLFQSDFEAFRNGLTAEEASAWWYGPIGFEKVEGDSPATLRGTTVSRMAEYRDCDAIATPHYRDWDGSAEHFDPGSATEHRARAARDWSWKSSGCTFVDGALYWAVARHGIEQQPSEDEIDVNLRQTAQNCSIIRSTDYGRTWTRDEATNHADPMFPGPRFGTPFFVDYGLTPPSVDRADEFVYATSNNGFWDNGDDLILGRVRRDRIARLDGADWEFYRGGDGGDDASWAGSFDEAESILVAKARVGETGPAYLPHRGTYVLFAWSYTEGGGHYTSSATTRWELYEAPHPWGPWTQVGEPHVWSPQGFYVPIVYPLFRDGDRIFVATSGDFRNWYDHYHLTLVPVELG